MWYPNAAQWRVIWIAAVLAGAGAAAEFDSATAFSICVIGFSALLVWKVQRRDGAEVAVRCQRCGKETRPEWQYCPFCGEFLGE